MRGTDLLNNIARVSQPPGMEGHNGVFSGHYGLFLRVSEIFDSLKLLRTARLHMGIRAHIHTHIYVSMCVS